MSNDNTSPRQPPHMSNNNYNQQGPPPPNGPPATLNGLAETHRYNEQQQDGQMQSAPQSPAVAAPSGSGSGPVTKGKNGATGPAEGKPKPHVCPICQRGFTTGGHLQRHQRIHTGIKAFKCPYPGCETRTSRQDNLQQHYRTHLSPTLRRGSGTAARQAVAAAMMAAGLKSSTSRQPRKSKGSQVGTPGSSSGASVAHGQSPYTTPTQSTAPYGGYMYDPNQQHGTYQPYPVPPPPGVNMAQPQSAQSSRVPSPVNGHASNASMPSAHHQQYFSQPQFPAYAYPSANYGQAYARYGAPNAMPSPYGAHPSAHHSMYSPGMAPDHGQQHMYSSLPTGFAHSRDSQYNVIAPNGYPSQAPMGNGYPPRAQTSTPLSGGGAHEELDPRYRGAGGAPRAQSPARRRLTPPQQADMIAPGVVDPSNMSTNAGQPPRPPQPPVSAMPQSYTYSQYTYQTQQSMPPPGQGQGQGRDAGAPGSLRPDDGSRSDNKGEYMSGLYRHRRS